MQKIKCDCNIIHKDNVNEVVMHMPKVAEITNVAKIFKALGDNTRMSIMFALLNKELCVCDISAVINMTKSAVSHQLATLKKLKLVKARRQGKEVFYSLEDDHIKVIINQVFEHSNNC